MKIGLQLVWYDDWGDWGATLAQIARLAEDAGFYSLWTVDHFFQMEGAGRAEDPMPEAYTMLTYAAAVTTRLRLGTLVTGVVYRQPAALVKTVTTLDVLSGGRAYLGIGAAWYEREARGLGFPFPRLSTRFEQLEETLQIATRLWSGQPGQFNGKHYQLSELLNSPAPVSRPHPPILVGGSGEKITLRLVAQYGDACNFDGGLGVDGVRHKLNVLRGHCAALGRDYDSIERTVVTGGTGRSAQDILDTCHALAEAGVQHVMFNFRDVHTLRPLEMFGTHIIPALAAL